MNPTRIDSLIQLDPRVMAAGFWGGTVYLHLLLLNHAHRCLGLIPPQYCSPEYLARYLGLDGADGLSSSGRDLIRHGLRSAAAQALIAVEPDGVRLVDSEHWESESAERVRRHRRRKRANLAQRGTIDSPEPGLDQDECANLSHDDAAQGGASRGAENAGVPGDSTPPASGAPGAILTRLAQGQVAGSSRAAAGSGSGPSAQSEAGDNCNVTVTLPSLPLSPPPVPPLFSPPHTPPLISPPNPPLQSPTHRAPPSSLDQVDGSCNVTVTPSDLGLEGGDLELPFAPGWLGQSAPIKQSGKTRAKKSAGPEPAAQAMELAHVLHLQVRKHAPNTRMAKMEGGALAAQLSSWARSIDKLNRIDGVVWTEIAGTIEWVGRHKFWGSVILSGENLRDKWDKIQAQRGANRGAERARGRYEPEAGSHADGDQQL